MQHDLLSHNTYLNPYNSLDIPQLQRIRNAVKENILSKPDLVTQEDYIKYICQEGKGWVCEKDKKLVGFSIVDTTNKNVWALFVDPDYEKQGIGKKLMDLLLNWHFKTTTADIWLGTAFDTRAEKFYRLQGWKEHGIHGTIKRKFMTHDSGAK